MQGPIDKPQQEAPEFEHMDEAGPSFSLDDIEDYLQTPSQPSSHDVEDVWDAALRKSREAEAATHDEDCWRGLQYRANRGQPAPRWSPSG